MVKNNQNESFVSELLAGLRCEKHALSPNIAWLENVAKQCTNSAITLRLAIFLMTEAHRYERRAQRVHNQMLMKFKLNPSSAYRALETLKNEKLIELTRAHKKSPLVKLLLPGSTDGESEERVTKHLPINAKEPQNV